MLNHQKQLPTGALCKKLVLKILQKSNEITCARVSVLIKPYPAASLRNRIGHRCFYVNFTKFLRISLLPAGRLVLQNGQPVFEIFEKLLQGYSNGLQYVALLKIELLQKLFLAQLRKRCFRIHANCCFCDLYFLFSRRTLRIYLKNVIFFIIMNNEYQGSSAYIYQNNIMIHQNKIPA